MCWLMLLNTPKNGYLCAAAIRRAMKHTVLYLLLMFLSFSVSAEDVNPKNALKSLDREINHRDVYLKSRRHRIDSLRSRMLSGRPSPELYLQLGDAYNSFNNDSLLYFYRLGEGMYPDNPLSGKMQLRRLACQPLAGITYRSTEEFAKVDTSRMSREMLREYYNCGRQMYSYISRYYKDFPELADSFRLQSLNMQRRLVEYLPVNSGWRLFNEAELAYSRHQYDVAAVKLKHLLKTVDEEDNLYARVAHLQAQVEKQGDNFDGYQYYLTRSAIADIKSGTLEVASLQELAELLHDRGEIDRPYRYLTIALDNAVRCGAQMRIIESTKTLPMIERLHNADMNRARMWLVVAVALLAVVLLCLVGVLYYLRREVRNEKKMSESLENANKVKDIYLARFLDLCSIYVDKMNKLCQVVHRKITAGKTEDLDSLVRSGKFIEEESKEFYQTFDDAFLHIYPTFHEDVNKLLRPDAQIELKPNEKLNTDLRILAFMRLGIEESARIAQVMNYSVNTIYTYRNKMRGRAIDRDSFEADVMRIGEIEDIKKR